MTITCIDIRESIKTEKYVVNTKKYLKIKRKYLILSTKRNEKEKKKRKYRNNK